jgi:hypothetical protein
MNKIKKTKYFKYTAWLIVFLLIFQADFLLAVKEKPDHEKQLQMAQIDVNEGKYENAIVRLERLIKVLDTQKEKPLLKKVDELLKRIKALKISPGNRKIIEKPVPKPKKKKKFPVLLVLAGVAVVGVGVYLLGKGKKEPPKTANIDISFSPNPVYKSSDGYCHYQVILNETNGVGVTLTNLEYSPGTWHGGTPADLFGTDFISANGMLSADVRSWGYSHNTIITFTFWGDDANGHKYLKWSGTVTLKEYSPRQSSSTSAAAGYNKAGGSGASLKLKNRKPFI